MAEIWVRGVSHLREAEVNAMCALRVGVEEITDECAVTIAALWQSPGRGGEHFAALASGAKADTDGLFANVNHAYTHDVPRMPPVEQAPAKLQLDMFGTWLVAKVNGRTGDDDGCRLCVTCGERPWGFGYCGEECEECAKS